MRLQLLCGCRVRLKLWSDNVNWSSCIREQRNRRRLWKNKSSPLLTNMKIISSPETRTFKKHFFCTSYWKRDFFCKSYLKGFKRLAHIRDLRWLIWTPFSQILWMLFVLEILIMGDLPTQPTQLSIIHFKLTFSRAVVIILHWFLFRPWFLFDSNTACH